MTEPTPMPAVRPESETIAERIAQSTRRMELRDPDAGRSLAERIVNRVVEIAGVSVLVAIVVVIFANAVSRYAFNYSFIWAEELVQMAMPWLAMTGVFLAVRRGSMIRIDFFFDRIPQSLQGTIANLGYAVSIGVLLFMGWISLDFVRLFGSDVALYVEIPTGWSTSALVFGSVGAALAFLAELFREYHERKRTRSAGS